MVSALWRRNEATQTRDMRVCKDPSDFLSAFHFIPDLAPISARGAERRDYQEIVFRH